jgi:hypothetical protein
MIWIILFVSTSSNGAGCVQIPELAAGRRAALLGSIIFAFPDPWAMTRRFWATFQPKGCEDAYP